MQKRVLKQIYSSSDVQEIVKKLLAERQLSFNFEIFENFGDCTGLTRSW